MSKVEARESSPEDDQSITEDVDGKAGNAQSKRACDYCHRMKMRCINKENPPCNRCRQSGHACTFDGPRKSKANRVEDRLKLVEAQMGNFQSSLNELLSLHRAAAGVAPPAGMMARMPGGPAEQSTMVSLQGPTPESHPTPGTMLSLESLFEPPGNYGSQAQQPPSNGGPNRWLDTAASHTAGGGSGAGPMLARSGEVSSAPMSDDEDEQDTGDRAFSGPWRSMYSLAEAARLERDGQPTQDAERDGLKAASRSKTKSKVGPFDYDTEDGRDRKRRKGEANGAGDVLSAMPEQRGSDSSSFLDPVAMGWCTEARGKQLYDSFMQNCLFYIPVLDPETDTWESLRKRSPFVITTILHIATKCEDAGGEVSELQKKCREHAEKIGMSTLFTPIARLEVVQALIIMAAWGDTSWRPGGHGLRIAIEMCLWRCLPWLAQTGMGAGKTPEELKEERSLVIGARIWLTLYKTECQMASNFGRPTMFTGPETVKEGRAFLSHPMSIPTDSRLVNFCELQTIRLPLHQPYNTDTGPETVFKLHDRIREANEKLDEWYLYWDQYYERLGYQKTNILRESLITMCAGAILYTNSFILNGVRSKRDISLLPEQRYNFLIKAVRSAERLIATALRGGQYTERFRYANTATHVNTAYVARFIIRMSSLMPEVVNVRQVGRDVEQIAQTLSKVPGFQFAQVLRNVLLKARRKRHLPPASKPASPQRGPLALPAMTANSSSPVDLSSGNFNTTPTGMGGGGSDPGLTSDLDFLYAEQLFSDTGALGAGSASMPPSALNPTSLHDQLFPFDGLYSFPPLETDQNSGTKQNQGLFPQGYNFGAPANWY